MTVAARRPLDRETVAARLLAGSARHSCDPTVEVDWDTPLDPALPAVPLHRVSLYGTPLWEQLTEQQRVQLSWHEFASVARVGLWFEVLLMQALLRHVYDDDPGSRHAQYALTEVGDETRHSVMFARAAALLAPGTAYGPPRALHELGRLFRSFAGGASMYASVLVAEETLDRQQREMLGDDGLLPLARQVARVHVTEEARHVSYAREAVLRKAPRLGRAALERHRLITALTSWAVVEAMVDPTVYAAVGLDPRRAVREARANPVRQESRLWSAERVTGFLRDTGMIGGPTTVVWRAAGLVA